MAQSIAILNSRVNGQGFTGAKIQQQGTDDIVVSVPHRSAEDIRPLLSSAVLRFRQVLLVAPGRPTALAPAPTASPSSSPSPGTASASPKAGAGASSSPSPSASASKSGGTGQAAGAKALPGSSSPTPSSSPKASASSSPSASPSPSPSPSASPTVRLPTAADASGDISKVTSKAVIADFNRLNCTNKKWQSEIYGDNPTKWDNAERADRGL